MKHYAAGGFTTVGILIASLKHMQMNNISLSATEMEKMANCQESNQSLWQLFIHQRRLTGFLFWHFFVCVCESTAITPMDIFFLWLFFHGVNKDFLWDKCQICGHHFYCFAVEQITCLSPHSWMTLCWYFDAFYIWQGSDLATPALWHYRNWNATHNGWSAFYPSGLMKNGFL